MAVAAVCHQSLCHIQSGLEVRCLVERQYRRKLLMCEGLGYIYRSNLTNQDLGLSRYGKSSQFCDRCSLLSYNLRIDSACLGQNDLAYLVQFILVQHMAAALDEFFSYCIIDICNCSYRLLGCTDHTIVKRLGMDD